METKEKGKQVLQWHPAFFADIQIEFSEEAQQLLFENEHQLGTKPKQIDVLIIKKDAEEPIHKNIGRIFRKYNIVEYKSPEDYLSIDDFYRGYGYACFYKADTGTENYIKLEELTVSFVCTRYPRKLMKHLEEIAGIRIQPVEDGIYYLQGGFFPIQIIVTSSLHEETNFWLKNLTNSLEDGKAAEKLVERYQRHRDDNLYISVMDIIVRANLDKFEKGGEKDMCEALYELIRGVYRQDIEQLFKRDMEQELKQEMEPEIEQRERQSVFNMLVSLVRQGLLQVSDAARQIDITAEEFEKRMQEVA